MVALCSRGMNFLYVWTDCGQVILCLCLPVLSYSWKFHLASVTGWTKAQIFQVADTTLACPSLISCTKLQLISPVLFFSLKLARLLPASWPFMLLAMFFPLRKYEQESSHFLYNSDNRSEELFHPSISWINLWHK